MVFIETEEGVLTSPREVLTMDALDRTGGALEKQGIVLEKLIGSGTVIRLDTL